MQLRQIVNSWEVDPVKNQECFEVFLSTLLSMKTNGIPRRHFGRQIILDI
jgi:hypothetical protein